MPRKEGFKIKRDVLAQEGGLYFWNAVAAVGRSDVVTRPNRASFVVLNTNSAPLCSSPPVSHPHSSLLLQHLSSSLSPHPSSTLLPACSPNFYPAFPQVMNILCNQSRGGFWEAGGPISPADFKRDEGFNCFALSENKPTAPCLTQVANSSHRDIKIYY